VPGIRLPILKSSLTRFWALAARRGHRTDCAGNRDIKSFVGSCDCGTSSMILAVDTPSGWPSDGQHAGRSRSPCTPDCHFYGAQEASCFLRMQRQSVLWRFAPLVRLPRSSKKSAGNAPLAGPDEFDQCRWFVPSNLTRHFRHVLLVAGSLGKRGAAISPAERVCGLRRSVTIATPDIDVAPHCGRMANTCLKSGSRPTKHHCISNLEGIASKKS